MTMTSIDVEAVGTEVGVASSTPLRSSGPRRRKTALHLGQVAVLVLVIVAWEMTAKIWKTDLFTSRPSRVWDAVLDWQHRDLLIPSIRITLHETFVGFIGGGISGAVLGGLLGRLRRLGDLLQPFVVALYSTPKIALAPLFILWFGIGTMPKIVLAGLLVFFFVFFTTYEGMRKLDTRLEDLARVMSANRFDVLRKVVLPQALMWVFVGAKIGLPYALLGAVAGELIASTEGLGYLIKRSSDSFNSAGTFAGIIILIVIAVLLSGLLRLLESKLLAWQVTDPKQ